MTARIDDFTRSSTALAALVDYQAGSVVSRTLIKKKTGTVTLFAFSQGQELSEHTAPFDALLQVVEGEARVTIAGKEHKIGAGEMIVLPANIPHAVSAAVDFKMLLTMIREES